MLNLMLIELDRDGGDYTATPVQERVVQNMLVLALPRYTAPAPRVLGICMKGQEAEYIAGVRRVVRAAHFLGALPIGRLVGQQLAEGLIDSAAGREETVPC